jgi:serine/threonine protein kinase
MAWPVSQDYNEAIQNPATSFADLDLRLGQPVVNTLGLPMPRSGAFADVYEVHSPANQTRCAVKCFTRAVPGLRERYAEISKHLKEVRLPFFVDFNYLDEGVRIRGQWYPVVKMQWVEGLLLNEFVRAHADKPSNLEALSQIWMKMARRLREERLAHGDLQHGNVLLVPGSKTRALAVKLIDYDGMWVPSLAQKRPGEVGHSAYQHPQRARDGTYNAELDRFPVLLVATVLRCLLVGGTKLWERYDNGDNLLFREVDLRVPGESPLFKELWQLPDVAARALVGQLMLASRCSLEQSPLLDELFADGKACALSPAQEKHVETLFETAPRPPPAPVAAVQTPLLLASAHPVTPYRIAAADAPPPRRRPPQAWATERRTQRAEPPASDRGKILLLGAAAAGLVVVVGTLIGAAIWRAGRPAPIQDALAQQRQDAGAPDQKSTARTPPGANPIAEPDRSPPPVPEKPPPPPEEPVGEVRRFEGHTEAIWRVAFSPDGQRILSASSDLTLRLWEVATGRELRAFKGHTAPIWGAAFSPTGKLALSGSVDRTVRLWDVDSGEQLQLFSGHGGQVDGVAFSSDPRTVFSVSRDDTIRIWVIETGKEIGRCGSGHVIGYAFAVSTHGDRVLYAGGNNEVCLWDSLQGRDLQRMPGHTAHVYTLALSADGRYGLSAGADNTIRLWDLSDGKQKHLFAGHARAVQSVAFSPDSRRILSGSDDRTVRLWDLETGQEIHRFEGHTGEVRSVAFSPDGRYAISGAIDKTVCLWRLPSAVEAN